MARTSTSTKKTTKAKEKAAEEPIVETAVEAVPEATEVPKNNEMQALKDQNDMLKKALEEMQAKIEALQNQPTTVVAYPADTEQVRFLWQAPVSDETQVDFGMYGRIVGKQGSFSVPKAELSRLLTAEVRMYLDTRWLIVVSGLNDEEREALGVDYKEGEVLDRQMFRKMVDMGDSIVEVYPALCKEHKEIVGKFFYEAWLNDPKRVDRNVVLQLYKIDKGIAFKTIIEAMNAKDIAE